MIPTLLTRKCTQRIRQACCPHLHHDRNGDYFWEKGGRVYLPPTKLVFRNRYWRIAHLAALVLGMLLALAGLASVPLYFIKLHHYLDTTYPGLTAEMVGEAIEEEHNER